MLVLLNAPSFAAGNDTLLPFEKPQVIEGTYKDFYIDNFGNVFLVTTNNQVKKLNEHFDSVAVFNDLRRYGDLYSLDVNNPLKIVVYYKDFTTLVILDRFLNSRNTIDLRNAGILQARAVTQSYDNNYWVFDELNGKIKKIDDNGNVLLESPDFRVLFSYEYNPRYIIDTDGALYLYDENKGWLIFDYYGAYKKHIDIPHLKNVSVSKGIVSGRDSSGFVFADTNTFSEMQQQTGMDISNAIKVISQQGKLFILEKDNLSVYRITTP